MKVYVNPAAGAMLDKDPNHVFQSKDVMWVERGEDWYGMHHYENRPAIIFDKELNALHPQFVDKKFMGL
jgi:hypothetical protein